MLEYVALAVMHTATTYGWGEMYCGDYDKPRPCNKEAVTSSGDKFDPKALTVAVPAPRQRITRPFYIYIKSDSGKCIKVLVNDKKNERYIGVGGLDLTPAVVKAITGKAPTPYWSGKIELCKKVKK